MLNGHSYDKGNQPAETRFGENWLQSILMAVNVALFVLNRSRSLNHSAFSLVCSDIAVRKRGVQAATSTCLFRPVFYK